MLLGTKNECSVKALRHTILNTFCLFLVLVSRVFFLGWFLILHEIVLFLKKKKKPTKNEANLIHLRGFVLQICVLFHIENMVEKCGFQVIL